MPTVAAALRVRRNGSPVAHLVDSRGTAYTLAYTPQEFTRGGITPKFEQVPISGRKPNLVQDALQLKTLQFTHTLTRPDRKAIDDQLRRLEALAASGGRVRLIAWDAGGARGWWNVVDLTIAGKLLTPEQKVLSADLTWQMVESNDPRPKIGRVRAVPLNPVGHGATPESLYMVRAGDTMWSIASTQLGDGERWHEIIELNPDKFPYGYNRGSMASLVGRTIRIPGTAASPAGAGGRPAAAN